MEPLVFICLVIYFQQKPNGTVNSLCCVLFTCLEKVQTLPVFSSFSHFVSSEHPQSYLISRIKQAWLTFFLMKDFVALLIRKSWKMELVKGL